MPALTKEVFVKKSEDIWGKNVWNYGKVVYVDYSTKVILICIEHNLECEQTPHQHLRSTSKGQRNKITACIECDKRKVLEYNTNQTKFIVIEFNKLTTKDYDNKSFVEIVCSITGKKSKSVPNNFWDSNDAINCYIKWFVYTFKLKNDDDWYKIQAETMNKYGGSGLLAKYNSSLTELLKYHYPEKEFLPWKFFRVGQKFWGECKDNPNISNQQRFIKWLLKDMGYDVNDYEKYYNITGAIITEKGANGLLKYYKDSIIKILETTFPEYKWLPWKFIQVPKSFDWKEKSNKKLWCEWFYSVNNFTSMEDWYKITQDLIKEYCGAGLLWHYTGSPVFDLLSDIYPEYNWIKSKFPVHGYSKVSIRFLDKLSKSIDTSIQHQYCDKGEYRFPEMKRFKADGYIEEYNDYKKIVIEFNGCYYHGCPYCFRDTTIMNKRCKRTFADLHKRGSDKYNKLKELGYIVIVIWECEYKQIVDMKKWFDENLLASLKTETAI